MTHNNRIGFQSDETTSEQQFIITECNPSCNDAHCFQILGQPDGLLGRVNLDFDELKRNRGYQMKQRTVKFSGSFAINLSDKIGIET